jgi:tetratricopeptide (TPR) repeat protein/TolB-like protein
VPDALARITAAFGRRYAVERELGRGGMGTVYLALDRKHGRRVAIKVLPPDVAAALGPERFRREIGIAARLSHPNILPLHDSGEAGDVLYYVMPHVAGESLRERLLREHRLPVAEAVEIACQIAGALDYAHHAGVIHRDVKPENILLTAYPPLERAAPGQPPAERVHALLADFGIARALARNGDGPADRLDSLRTDSGLPVGTVAYASPEQAAGSRELDGRTDVYSLGCVLYEMLVGDGPAGGPAASQILEKRFAESLPPVRSLRPEVPTWVEDALARALTANFAHRFATAGELRQALAAPASSTALSLLPDPRVFPKQPGAPRQRRALWMGGGAATLAIIGAAAAFLPRFPRADPRRVVVAGFENRTGDSGMAPVGDIASDYIARGLAATRLMHEVYDLRVAAEEAGDTTRVGGAAGRALAKRVGAGTVISGRYYRDGDSLHIEAQLVDAPTGRVIVSLEPAVGLAREETRVVETLRQRVMAGFAVVFGSEFDTWKAASLPPTYEAYQEMLAAGQTEFDFATAAEHYRRAAALDPSFTGAATSAAVALWLGRDCRAVDSIARHLEPQRRQLPPVDRGQLELATAACQNDPDGAIAAVRRTIQASPRSVAFTILGAVIAMENGRPHQSLEILHLVNPTKLGMKGWLYGVYMDWLAMSYHMVGDYRGQLEAARTGLRGDSTSPHLATDQAIALAALGRVAEAERLALGFLPQGHSADDPWPAPMATECVALELRAHGHPEAARRIFERVIAWYGASAVTDATRDDWPCTRPHLNVFYQTGRWQDARAGYEHLLAEDSASLKAHAALGVLAVRRGDQAEADRMDAWLASRAQDADAAYARARLEAVRGNRDQAVMLLHQAFERGRGGRIFLHLDPDFELLRDYPPYQELMQVKQ